MKNNEELEYSREDFKKKLLAAFKFTIDFLNQHNLRWFVGGGTCIGTIRHKGLIPWDDDIDIFMPRDDYNELLLLQKELDCSDYEIISWKNGHSPSPFAKVIDKNTTLWELKYQPFVTGVFVDIFPMDLSDDDEETLLKQIREYDRYLNLYWSSISDYSIKDLFSLLRQKSMRYFGLGLMSYFTNCQKDYYLNILQTLEERHNRKNGKYYVLFAACFAYSYRKEIFKKEWFDDYLLMPFEGIEVRIPIGFDAYLTHVYGDYMELPPKEKRITRHYHYYLNLEERKTIDEIIDIKKKGRLIHSVLITVMCRFF